MMLADKILGTIVFCSFTIMSLCIVLFDPDHMPTSIGYIGGISLLTFIITGLAWASLHLFWI